MTDRLTEIKRRWSPEVDGDITDVDIEWLIAEVERLRQEKQNVFDNAAKALDEWSRRALDAEAEVERLRALVHTHITEHACLVCGSEEVTAEAPARGSSAEPYTREEMQRYTNNL
jgi:hypothetical protein